MFKNMSRDILLFIYFSIYPKTCQLFQVNIETTATSEAPDTTATSEVDPSTEPTEITPETTLEPDFIFDVEHETDTTSDADFLGHVDPAFKAENKSATKPEPTVKPALQPDVKPAVKLVEPSGRSFEWYF